MLRYPARYLTLLTTAVYSSLLLSKPTRPIPTSRFTVLLLPVAFGSSYIRRLFGLRGLLVLGSAERLQDRRQSACSSLWLTFAFALSEACLPLRSAPAKGSADGVSAMTSAGACALPAITSAAAGAARLLPRLMWTEAKVLRRAFSTRAGMKLGRSQGEKGRREGPMHSSAAAVAERWR